MNRSEHDQTVRVIEAFKSKVKILPDMKSMMAAPKQQCMNASKQIFDLARQDGLKPHIVQLVMWVDVLDEGPTNHFAVRIMVDGKPYIIDATITQFQQLNMSLDTIYSGPENDWIERIKSAHKGSAIKLRSEPQTTLLDDKAIGQAILYPGELVAEPAWYALSKSPSVLALASKEQTGHRLYIKNTEIMQKIYDSPRMGIKISGMVNKMLKGQLSSDEYSPEIYKYISNKNVNAIKSPEMENFNSKTTRQKLDALLALESRVNKRLNQIADAVNHDKAQGKAPRDVSNDVIGLIVVKIYGDIIEQRIRIQDAEHTGWLVGERRAGRQVLDVRSPVVAPVQRVEAKMIELPWRSARVRVNTRQWDMSTDLDIAKVDQTINDFMHDVGVTPDGKALKLKMLTQKELVDEIKLDRPDMTIGYDANAPETWVSGYTKKNGEVLMAWDHPDYINDDGTPDLALRQSTFIHEAVHSHSKGSRGFQAVAATDPDRWIDNNMNIDEMVTDYIAYKAAKKLGIDYVSAYSARDLDAKANMIWIGNFISYLQQNDYPVERLMKAYFSSPADLKTDAQLQFKNELVVEWKKYAKQMQRVNKKNVPIARNPLYLLPETSVSVARHPGGSADRAPFVRPARKDYPTQTAYATARQRYLEEVARFQGAGRNTLKTKPRDPDQNDYASKALHEKAIEKHQRDVQIWQRAGEEVNPIAEVPYGPGTEKMQVLSSDTVSVGYQDVGDFRLIAGYGKDQPPASSPIQTLIVASHGHYDGPSPNKGPVPSEINVQYPVPFGMIATVPPVRSFANRISLFKAHTGSVPVNREATSLTN